MIVVTAVGGLGNQLFQYAFARGLSESLGRRAVLDVTMFPFGELPYQREFQLPRVLHPRFALPSFGIRAVAEGRHRRLAIVQRSVGLKVRRAVERYVVREPQGVDVLLNIGDVPSAIAWFVGYWQSHHYFEHIGDELRRELRPEVSRETNAYRVLNRLRGRTTIAVHVRRGDYASIPRVAKVHGTLGDSFYSEAVRQVVEKCGSDAVAVILSDEPTWAAEHLRLGVPMVHAETEGPLASWEALALMTRCDHHVIANSSLSWWGAWLAGEEGQHVRYPERWFAGRSIDASYRFPANWVGVASVP